MFTIVRKYTSFSLLYFFRSGMMDGPCQPVWREKARYSELTEAQKEVKRLHSENLAETFAIRHTNGAISDWAYDYRLSQKQSKFYSLTGMAVIALLLCLPVCGVFSFIGIGGRPLAVLTALAPGSYFLLGFFYNRIEAFAIWLMLFVIFICTYAAKLP